jgi:acetyl esterase/lipase
MAECSLLTPLKKAAMMRSPARLSLLLIATGTIGLTVTATDAAAAEFPKPILLWPEGAPGATGDEDVDKPTIRIYQAQKPNGAGVLICPGGGYGALATDHEGHQLAVWYQKIGVTAAVLKYRLGRRYQHPAPLNDTQRALRYLRSHADELKLSSDRIGVMGFSAGGHLASTLSTHYDAGDPQSEDPIERVSCRPDFTVLGYPVISLIAAYSHGGSARNLLGESPDPELLKSLSNETQVTPDTPPAFIFQTNEDKGVPAENALHYVLALRKHGVPCELHLYQQGPHGVGMGVGDPVLASWIDRLHDWLKTNGILTDTPRAAVSGTVTIDGEPLRWGTITFQPEGGDSLPVAWAMVSRGKYQIPVERGAVQGTHRVVIRNLGDVAPYPTIADAAVLEDSQKLRVNIGDAENTFDFDLTAK